MPLAIDFTYPAPVSKPRPVKAKLDPVVIFNTQTNEVSGFYAEYLENTENPSLPPVLDSTRKPFKVLLSDAQLQQILAVIIGPAQEQGVLVPGSTPVIVAP